MDSNSMPDIPGYEIKEQLGSGGGGRVYKAWHINLRKDVIIKRLHMQHLDEATQRTEVDILKNIHHPYLPQVFDFFVIDGYSYTVMDYVQGKSLQQLINDGMKFSEKMVLKIARELTEALAYLHSQSIPVIHGDIKPANIMYTPDEHICLIDFNISGMSASGNAVSYGYSAEYCAPEQRDAVLRIHNEIRRSLSREYDSVNDRTERIDRYEDKTEILPDNYFEYETDKMWREEAQYTEKITHMPGIPISKRSDVYSVGATLYRLYADGV